MAEQQPRKNEPRFDAQKNERLRAWLAVMVTLAALLPALWIVSLVFGWWGIPSADPVEEILSGTGLWTLNLLMITILFGLTGFVPQMRELLYLRKITGIFSFLYATAHLFTYLVLDRLLVADMILEDLFAHPRIMVGMIAYLLLTPSFFLSFAPARAAMGDVSPSIWKQVQRMIHLATILGIVHFGMVQKLDIGIPALYGIILAFVLSIRLFADWARRSSNVH